MLPASAPDTSFLEHAARRFERKPTPEAEAPRWPTPGELARTLDRRIIQTPALDLMTPSWCASRTPPAAG